MRKSIKISKIIVITLFMIFLVGCKKTDNNDDDDSNNFSISFVSNSEEEIDIIYYDYGEEIDEITAPDRDGYFFSKVLRVTNKLPAAVSKIERKSLPW